MGKDVSCYGCEKRHVEHGYNCHSDCPDYKAFHEERTAKIALFCKKRNEEAMVVDARLRAIRKTSGEKAIQTCRRKG